MSSPVDDYTQTSTPARRTFPYRVDASKVKQPKILFFHFPPPFPFALPLPSSFPLPYLPFLSLPFPYLPSPSPPLRFPSPSPHSFLPCFSLLRLCPSLRFLSLLLLLSFSLLGCSSQSCFLSVPFPSFFFSLHSISSAFISSFLFSLPFLRFSSLPPFSDRLFVLRFLETALVL